MIIEEIVNKMWDFERAKGKKPSKLLLGDDDYIRLHKTKCNVISYYPSGSIDKFMGMKIERMIFNHPMRVE